MRRLRKKIGEKRNPAVSFIGDPGTVSRCTQQDRRSCGCASKSVKHPDRDPAFPPCCIKDHCDQQQQNCPGNRFIGIAADQSGGNEEKMAQAISFLLLFARQIFPVGIEQKKIKKCWKTFLLESR